MSRATASALSQAHPRPANPAERIASIDVLRGLALFGVLAVNLVTLFRIDIFEWIVALGSTTSPIDRATEAFVTIALELKAFALFSLLFGIGLAIQHERLARSPRRLELLLRRLLVLLAIGLIHLVLIWNGDILTEYAVAAILVLPLLWGPDRLLAGGALALLAYYIVMPLLPPLAAFPTADWMRAHGAEARQVYGTGSFADVLAFRIAEIPAFLPLHILIFPRTLGLFLLGIWAWRSRLLQNPAAHRRLLLLGGLGAIVAGAAFTTAADGRVLFGWPSLGPAADPLERIGSLLLALGYAASVIAAMQLPVGQRLLGWAAPLGRMAFTNYLLQSILFGWIFYGYGLGLFGRVGATATLAMGIAVYAGQVLLSAWWLKRYRFGPVEWLWRSLMYGTRQPMRLARPTWVSS